jgi:Uma2 family endonuclease
MLAEFGQHSISEEEYFDFVFKNCSDTTRYELIEGEIVAMSPEGSSHDAHITQALEVFIEILFKKVQINIQNHLKLRNNVILLPDICILRRQKGLYKNALPEAKDALLVVEVSDTTLARDRGNKLSLYAQAGIVEVWILVVESGALEVYRNPVGDHYAQQLFLSAEDKIAMLAFPDLLISVSDLIP